MPFIGNSVQNQGFAPAVDYFNGDGTTVTFTLSRPVASVAQLTAVIENVIQNPATAFTVSSNSITFTSAPPSGTNNIWIEYTSLITTYAAISQDPSVVGDITASGGYLTTGDFGNSYLDGTIVDYVSGMARITTGESDNMTFYHGGTASRSEMMTLYHAGGAKIFGNTALTIPVGTTAERPGTPAVGMIRYNTTLGYPEWYSATTSSWAPIYDSPVYTAEYLVIAGGGGGGSGGGGAGGLLAGSSALTSGVAYTITVGAGASGRVTSEGGFNGSNSSISTISITAVGGGGGGGDNGVAISGGSGGGAGCVGGTGQGTAGSGTSGQGNSGGLKSTNNDGPAGGGGGAGAVGGTGSGSTAGSGGSGLASSISGSSVTYAGGGGGSFRPYIGGSAGSGGSGGGGNGASSGAGGVGGNGTANTGSGGGGGAGYNTSGTTFGTGGNGGSGIVIVRYFGAQRGTGGTVTSSGGYTIHTFTTSGTYTA